MLFGAKSFKLIHERLEQLEHRQNELNDTWLREKIEFADLYDRVYRILKRFEMRERRAETPEEEPAAAETPCPDPITARVLARREGNKHVLV